jgi:hypothetical protein
MGKLSVSLADMAWQGPAASCSFIFSTDDLSSSWKLQTPQPLFGRHSPLLLFPSHFSTQLSIKPTLQTSTNTHLLGGGMRTTTNRTNWPINGGAIALQPGWFQGHATDNGPPNMSFPMVPVFQIVGPSKNPYPGTICLPQVPLPSGIPTPNVGDNATIQVVETAIHGAALYSVSPKFPKHGGGKLC